MLLICAGNLPKSYSGMLSLSKLLLSKNNLTGEVPGNLSSFRALRTLEMDSNKLIGECFEASLQVYGRSSSLFINVPASTMHSAQQMTSMDALWVCRHTSFKFAAHTF